MPTLSQQLQPHCPCCSVGNLESMFRPVSLGTRGSPGPAKPSPDIEDSDLALLPGGMAFLSPVFTSATEGATWAGTQSLSPSWARSVPAGCARTRCPPRRGSLARARWRTGLSHPGWVRVTVGIRAIVAIKVMVRGEGVGRSKVCSPGQLPSPSLAF